MSIVIHEKVGKSGWHFADIDEYSNTFKKLKKVAGTLLTYKKDAMGADVYYTIQKVEKSGWTDGQPLLATLYIIFLKKINNR